MADDPSSRLGSDVLCRGYDECKNAGMPHYGYKQNQGAMYWRMYSGTNCTNYVAYRLVKGGMPNVRPWSSTGNAYNWGYANASKTNSTPTVGSVAWFTQNYHGAGSVGHVAYVEKVISPSEVIVSESNYGSTFSYRRLVKGTNNWPKGFIHFNDKALKTLSTPTLTGTASVGQTLQVSAGSWSPTPSSVSYTWLANGQPIAGATGRSLVLGIAHRKAQISVRVVAKSPNFADYQLTTPATDPVARGQFASTTAPVITGTPQAGQILEIAPGAWSPEPTSRSWAWAADGEPIPGATGKTLTLDKGLVGARITAGERAAKQGFFPQVRVSEPTAAVLAGQIEVTEAFGADGAPRPGATVSVRQGAFEPSDASLTYQWRADGQPISGASGTTFSPDRDLLGQRLSVTALMTKPTYAERQVTLQIGMVRNQTRLSAKAAGRSRKVLVVAKVKAPGVGRVNQGEAKLRVGKRQVKVSVNKGRIKKWIPRVQPGKKKVVVRFLGTRELTGQRVSTRTYVKR